MIGAVDESSEGCEFLMNCRFNEMDEAKLALKTNPLLAKWSDEFGNTGLHMAAANGNAEILLHLLSFISSVDVANHQGGTPLHWYFLI